MEDLLSLVKFKYMRVTWWHNKGDGLAGTKLALRCGCRMGTSTEQCPHSTTQGGTTCTTFWSFVALSWLQLDVKISIRALQACQMLRFFVFGAAQSRDDWDEHFCMCPMCQKAIAMCWAGVISVGWEWTCKDNRRERRDSCQPKNTARCWKTQCTGQCLLWNGNIWCHDIIQHGILDWLFKNDNVSLNWIFLCFSVSIAAGIWTIPPTYRARVGLAHLPAQ